jgi:Concanavalin A-like lectin/glucanases superfamily
LRMGGNSLWGEYFQGRIDDVRIYNRALSAAEIQADSTTPIP